QSRAIAAGQEPPDLRFAAGYPSVDTLEVADLFTGPRSAELPGLVPYVIIRRADDRAIGDIGYTLSPDTQTATVGYDINPNDQGKGYATEALRRLTAALFASRVRTVRADTYSDHLASRRVMEKDGMTL